MRIDVFSIFPEVVDTFCRASLLGKARGAGLLDLRTHDLREHTADPHRTVDDTPFGGGAGMLMRAEPVFASITGSASTWSTASSASATSSWPAGRSPHAW